MPNKENIREQATENQMDCEGGVEALPAGSTIGATGGPDYEDGLSSELSCEFQESSTRSSSANSDDVWYSALTYNESIVETANAASDKVMQKAAFFVKTFVGEFERKLFQYSKEAKPGSKTQKRGKIFGQIDSTIKSAISPGMRVIADKAMEFVHYFPAKEHKKGAKRVSAAVMSSEDQTRKILVEAGLEIFQSFERQFIKVTDAGSSSWRRGIEKLAIDAVSRVINYISANIEQERFCVDLITKGFISGESKTDTFAKQVLHKPAKFLKSEAFQPGYQVKDKQSDKTLVTSELYKGVGIERKDGDATSHYQSKEHNYAKKYGYRLPFAWELERWSNKSIYKEYTLVTTPEEYKYILDNEKKEELASSILKEIDGEDLVQKKDIEGVKEHLRKQDENMCQFSFNFDEIPKIFIERKEVLKELITRLNSKSQELKMSRVVLISGSSGVGKSELARGCGFSQRHHNAWLKIMWIDASSNIDLSNSFLKLAKRLGISTKDRQGQKRKIKSIVEDIYKHLQDTKSFFVFDDASDYEKIKDFLPSNFSFLSSREKPFVLITSSNKNWKKEIEEIELDNFKPGEAEKFIRKALGKDELHNNSISELAERLNYSPLALKTAMAYIKQKGLSIRKYLEEYKVTQQQSKPNLVEVQGVNKKFLKVLKMNIDKIKEEKNVGQQAYVILVFMAYLDPNQINTKEIFFKGESKENQQRVLYALDLLNQFSLIGLEKGIAKIHQEVQKMIRLEQRKEEREEKFLRKIMISLMNNNCKNVSHVISIWNYASEYKKLVNEFIESDYYGMNILHFLAIDDNEEVIKLIFENVDPSKLSKIVNVGDQDGSTPLEYAVIYDHLALVKYFIGKGADFKVNDPILNLLDYAALHNRLEIVKYFIDNEYFQFDSTVLYYAIENHCLEVVRYFIEEKKMYINLKDGEGKGYLHYAVEHSSLEIFEYLLAYGATVDLQDKKGMTPLHFAAIHGRLRMLKSLIKKKAVIEVSNKDAMTPLHFAAIYGYLGIVRYLVGHGAGINLQNEDHMTPLHFAIMHDHLGIIDYLVRCGADINLQNKNYMSPLHFADIYGHQDIIDCLVMNRASTNLYDIPKCHFFLGQGANVKLKFKDGLYHNATNYCTNSMCYYGPQSTVYSASDLKTQSHKRRQDTSVHLSESKKRRLENMSAASEKNASNIQLLQGGQDNVNLPSGISMQFEGPFDRIESMVSVTNRIPMSSLNSIAVEPVNNKNLKGSYLIL